MQIFATTFHFGQPWWLLGLLLPLLLWGWRGRGEREWMMRYAAYADSHLLPHLVSSHAALTGSVWRIWWRWIALWVLAVLAMAGPRWDYHTVEIFTPASELVILLDLSRSMDATDLKPSRLGRARQELEDLLRADRGARVGLVGFATVAHVVAPLTEDYSTVRRLLPALHTQLLNLQGSRLSAALETGARLLAGQPAGSAQAMLLISDGDFVEPELITQVKALSQQGIRLHVLGMGTLEGAQIPGPHHAPLRDRHGLVVTSQLAESQLQALAQAGGGVYVRGNYRDDDTRQILERLGQDAPPTLERNPLQVWHERFYWLILLMLGILLLWFRQGRNTLLDV